MIALLAVVAAGCSSSERYALVPVPQIFVMVDSIQVTAGKCSLFAPDQTNGQLTYRKHLVVRNSGNTGSVLCLNKVKWESTNTLLKWEYTSTRPTDAKACPAVGAIALAAGKSIGIDVIYAPSADKVDNGQAILTIENNDQKASLKGPTSLCFGISTVGPQITMDTNEYTYINTSAANPATTCFKFGNSGTAPLCFDDAGLDPANAQYSIVEKPNKGDCISAIGDSGNPLGTPTKMQVCVRYSPDKTEGNEDENVIIVTNDPTKPNAQVKLGAKTQADNKYTISCTTASGKLEYDFTGVTSGTAEATCAIFNDGPASMVINTATVQALDAAVDQSTVDGIYKSCVHLTAGDKTCVDLPRGVSKSGTIYVTVKFAFPAGNAAPNGNLMIGFAQASIPGTIAIPVSAGACAVPAPSFGPMPQLWLLAGVGQKASGTFMIANQSCAPMRVINACVTAATVPGADPCSKAVSVYSGLAKPFASQDIEAWGLLPLEVEFHPPDDKKLNVNDLVSIVYCAGAWAGDKCNGTIVTQSLNLQGSIKTELAAPTLSLGTTADYPDAKVGQPVHIKATFTKGQYADGNNYLWVITKRPAGSKRWLTPPEQATSTPDLIFIPDVAGNYEIAALAQAFDEDSPQNYNWSSQVKLTLTVQ